MATAKKKAPPRKKVTTKAKSMAKRTSKSEAATRKVERMLGENQTQQKKKPPKKKVQATKVAGKMGPSQRTGPTTLKTRKDDKKTRIAKLKDHFKKVLTGKSTKRQGKK